MTDRMREEFEEVMRAQGWSWISRHGDGYESEEMDSLWEGFKLGRESLVVDFTYCVLPHEFAEAAKEAGLKVKP